MTSKLIPANPSDVMVIRDISPNITILSVPFLRFGLGRVGGRGTIVRLSSGSLAVFSPVSLTPEVKAKIEALGNNVAYIVAPNIEHHIFLSDWHRAYPNAHVIGPEGLPEKRAATPSITYSVPFTTVFTAKNKGDIHISEEFDRDFEYEYVDSHPSKDIIFFYKPDKTLIEADYLFNLPATEQYSRTGEPANKGLLTKLFIRLNSISGTALGQKRLLWYLLSVKNREGFKASAIRVAKWDFNTIIPCHGDVIEGDGKGIFQKVFEWHLQGKK